MQYEFEIGDKPEENPGSPGGPRSPGDSNGNSGGSPGSPAGDPVVTLTDSDDETTTQTLPDHFTPASLLAPDGGLRTLLGDATDLDTESREDIDGVPAWRVSANIPQEQMSQLLPGIPDDVAAKFWVTDSEDAAERTLLRVWLQVPPRTPNEGAVLVELGLTGHNEPVEASSTAATPPDDTNDTNDTEPTEGE
ncbi:hypothetical protein BJF85_22670 [Saccharomonospora sp. CUA-673]|uniref:LppX_LprAFG lipoprotein n=1 Tax=Saccharomonospora sp. CUA-673 TaxID=1904969 RepID=UPI00095C65E7|nr:LppX_LprAFG lipoprotein [Saccharomonospora sp. CUA-673]OLT42519.1 hypothetical protein BJF85_22670 [Saccharomonospora sp. CUA-673]